MSRWITGIIIGLVLIGAAGAAGWYYLRDKPKNLFRTAAVTHGDIVAGISSTGTIEPQETVDVGAQVQGIVLSFGKDTGGNPVDKRSVVTEGTVLANIDPSLYAADLQTAKAGLAQAKANVEVSTANLAQMQAALDKATRDWNRAQKLGPGDALAQADYDTYEAAYETGLANVALAKAQITSNQATVVAAQASLAKAQQNLDYCTITSPVKGVVIDRRVNIGETVVSSLNTPSLFLIAKDLTRVQIWIAVNEADIGSIYAGQPVDFTVDTYPSETFKGTVSRIDYNATMTQNVVTYTVEVDTDNSDSRLYPYMTANAQFETGRRENVMMVPAGALRWVPPDSMISPQYHDQYIAFTQSKGGGENGGSSGGGKGTTKPSGGKHHQGGSTQPGAATRAAANPHGRGVVWVQDGPNTVKPIEVTTGLSDGTNTEIQSDQLQDGQLVIVGEIDQTAAASSGVSPLVPQFRPANRQQPGQGGSTQGGQGGTSGGTSGGATGGGSSGGGSSGGGAGGGQGH